MDNCKESFYSEEYADYIIETGGNVEAIRRKYNPDCIQVIDENFVIIFEKIVDKGEISFEKYGYGAVPSCYGLLDTTSIESMGVERLRKRPNFDLYGSGVLIGFVDTGIDYTSALFRNADGSSRIAYIWDQSLQEGKTPQGIDYGTEYTKEEITEALKSENPKMVIPHEDRLYHGTFLAALAAGNEDKEAEFSGVAPRAEIMMVKVKEAKRNIRDFYGIKPEVPCYQENDIMMGIRYLWEKAAILRKPVVICIGMGSNSGSHSGASPLGEMINQLGSLSGICIVVAAGNETNLGHHYAGTMENQEEQIVEMDIQEENGMTLELWTKAPGSLAVGISTPDGEFSGRISIRSFEQRIDFVFEPTRVFVHHERIEYYSGEEVITMRFQNLTNGVWKITVFSLEEGNWDYNIWMPMRNFVNENTTFLTPSPDTIVTNPGNAFEVITFGAYNHRNNSIYLNSSRGFTSNNNIKPDLVAPGVDVYGPVSALRFGERSGTSVAAANGAGVAALMLEWGIVKENRADMNSLIIKYYFIKGARKEQMVVPNRSFGYGILDLYETFYNLRFT